MDVAMRRIQTKNQLKDGDGQSDEREKSSFKKESRTPADSTLDMGATVEVAMGITRIDGSQETELRFGSRDEVKVVLRRGTSGPGPELQRLGLFPLLPCLLQHNHRLLLHYFHVHVLYLSVSLSLSLCASVCLSVFYICICLFCLSHSSFSSSFSLFVYVI